METLTANQIVKELYNGTIQTVNTVIPIEHSVGKPQLANSPFTVNFGVLIGFTGDIKGELIIEANSSLLQSVGEKMFGMPVSEEMLESFSGELGNMLAGGLSTHLSTNGIQTDITHPTILNGSATLSGFKRALIVTISYKSVGEMDIKLLLNH